MESDYSYKVDVSEALMKQIKEASFRPMSVYFVKKSNLWVWFKCFRFVNRLKKRKQL